MGEELHETNFISPPPHSMGVVSLRGCPGGGLDCRRLIKKNFEKRQFEGVAPSRAGGLRPSGLRPSGVSTHLLELPLYARV